MLVCTVSVYLPMLDTSELTTGTRASEFKFNKCYL